MPNVAHIRQEVTELMPRWELVRDCLSGQVQVKSKGKTYLPKPNESDNSESNEVRYKQYKERAVFYNVTSRTLEGLIGQVFAKDPVLNLPKLLENLEHDIDGGSVSLEQQSKKTLSHVLSFGRAFLLADYPKTDSPASAADLESGNIRPTVTLYDPWDVINWRVTTVGAKKLLTLVVISESQVVDDDGFEQELEDVYKVLKIEGGVYVVEIWAFDKNLSAYVVQETFTPLDSSGKPWTEIPGVFVGPRNNDPTPDLPPLYDLASLNVAHYRNSADYEEAVYIVGQPTPFLAGLTQTWVDEVLKGVVNLGSRAAIMLPEGGSAGLLQANPNTMPKEAMEHKERQMVALGAKLAEQKTVQRTATEANIEKVGENSILASAAKNVSVAYTQLLKWCCLFQGAAETEVSFELNKEFEISKLTPQEVAQLIASWQSKAISFEEMRDNLRKGGVAYLEDDEVKTQIENDPLSFDPLADNNNQSDPAK